VEKPLESNTSKFYNIEKPGITEIY